MGEKKKKEKKRKEQEKEKEKEKEEIREQPKQQQEQEDRFDRLDRIDKGDKRERIDRIDRIDRADDYAYFKFAELCIRFSCHPQRKVRRQGQDALNSLMAKWKFIMNPYLESILENLIAIPTTTTTTRRDKIDRIDAI